MNQPVNLDPEDARALMRSVIQRIATGPELSKDISRAEAAQATRAVLEGLADPVQAAIFFIALRMKRETDEENLGVLDALQAATGSRQAAVDEVVLLVDPYDGYTRHLPAAPFLPALLAAAGVPTLTHGVESLGPKHGVTHRQVLAAAGAEVDLDRDGADRRLAGRGWAYLDQRVFCPALYDLIGLREKMVKRPVLTTVEVLLKPLCGRRHTHLFTGYVHKPYPRVYALLARAAGYDSLLLARGVEGGVIPSLRQKGRFVRYPHPQQPEQVVDCDPSTLGIDQSVRAAPVPSEYQDDGFDRQAVAALAAQQGLAALRGEPGPVFDALIYGAAACLWHLGRHPDLPTAAEAARRLLSSGAAWRHWEG